MFLSLLANVRDLGSPGKGTADTGTDRLNNRYTCLLLAVFMVLMSAKLHMGEPVQCWCPPHFTDSMVDFTNTVGRHFLERLP